MLHATGKYTCPEHLLRCTLVCICDYSGLRRVSPTSRRASTGGPMSFVTWLTTMWTTGSGPHLWSEGLQIASILRSNSQSGIAHYSRAMHSHVKKPSAYCTMSLMQQQENLHHGNQRATSSLVSMHSVNGSVFHHHLIFTDWLLNVCARSKILFHVCLLSSFRSVIACYHQPFICMVFPVLLYAVISSAIS